MSVLYTTIERQHPLPNCTQLKIHLRGAYTEKLAFSQLDKQVPTIVTTLVATFKYLVAIFRCYHQLKISDFLY